MWTCTDINVLYIPVTFLCLSSVFIVQNTEVDYIIQHRHILSIGFDRYSAIKELENECENDEE